MNNNLLPKSLNRILKILKLLQRLMKQKKMVKKQLFQIYHHGNDQTKKNHRKKTQPTKLLQILILKTKMMFQTLLNKTRRIVVFYLELKVRQKSITKKKLKICILMAAKMNYERK